jgi:integrase
MHPAISRVSCIAASPSTLYFTASFRSRRCVALTEGFSIPCQFDRGPSGEFAIESRRRTRSTHQFQNRCTPLKCQPCNQRQHVSAHDKQPNTSASQSQLCGGGDTVATVDLGATRCRRGTWSTTWPISTLGLTSAKPKHNAAALDRPRTIPAMAYKRAHRSGVEDRWHRRGAGTPCANPKHGKLGTLVESAKHGDGKRWRARFVNPSGREVERSFHVKAEATAWITAQTADIAKGSYVAPKDAVMTLDAWAERWLATYSKSRRQSSARQAKTHLKTIRETFGPMTLAEIKPSMVTAWTGKLQDDYSASTIYALYRRLTHVLDDAVHDGLLARNPCSRRTAPPMGHVEQFCPTTDQVWQLHDAMPDHLQVAVLLGAFAGLRVSEAVALRIEDVDFTRGIVHPKVGWTPDEGWLGPLKTRGSMAPVPIPQDLALLLSASVQQFPGPTLVTNGRGQPVGPWIVERAVDRVRQVDELHFHCLRHHLATLLIASGCDVKTVQARMRHASARTTLDVYAHQWEEREQKDDPARAAIGGVIAARIAASSGNPAGAVRAKRP